MLAEICVKWKAESFFHIQNANFLQNKMHMETRYVTFGLTSILWCEKSHCKATAMTILLNTFILSSKSKMVLSLCVYCAYSVLFHSFFVKWKKKTNPKQTQQSYSTSLRYRRNLQLNLSKLRAASKVDGLKTV